MPENYTVTEIELTPNPRAVKFILDQIVLDSGSKTIEAGAYLETDIFATNIFALEIIDLVYCRENFVSITLQSPDLWVIFKDKIKNIIEADLKKYEEGDDEVSSSILDDFDRANILSSPMMRKPLLLKLLWTNLSVPHWLTMAEGWKSLR